MRGQIMSKLYLRPEHLSVKTIDLNSITDFFTMRSRINKLKL